MFDVLSRDMTLATRFTTSTFHSASAAHPINLNHNSPLPDNLQVVLNPLVVDVMTFAFLHRRHVYLLVLPVLSRHTPSLGGRGDITEDGRRTWETGGEHDGAVVGCSVLDRVG